MKTIKQLFEILQKHNKTNLLHIESKVELKDGVITLVPLRPIHENTKISYLYYFYHHCNEEFPSSRVLKAIQEKDFYTFTAIYNEWEFNSNLNYLPNHLILFDETTEEVIGRVSGIWLKDIFELIDSADCECG